MRTALLKTFMVVGLSTLSLQTMVAQTGKTNWKIELPDVAHPKVATEQKIYSVDLKAIGDEINLKASRKIPISFPLGTGAEKEFIIKPNEVLIPSLAALNPEIKTYEGFAVDNSAHIRITASPYGLDVKIVLIGGGSYYIQSIGKETPNVLVSYDAALIIDNGRASCGLAESELDIDPSLLLTPITLVTGKTCALRTYVLAVAATGEYTTWAGGQAQALAKITTTVNNLNLIYERDMGVKFTLNSPNSILYTDAATDPFSTSTQSSPGSTALNECQNAITAALTSSGFDLGHVFNAGWSGGLASTPSACVNLNKARAASGLNLSFPSGPSGPIFDNTVAHEIAHQFSAKHTFSANNGGCNGNTNNATAWEPGGGSTIMAYGGTCTGNSYQSQQDEYFHAGSLFQMSDYIRTNIPTCGITNTTLGNVNPTATVSANAYTIPGNTPFKLTLNATDATNGGLTYTWEQMDPIAASGNTGTAFPPSSTATVGAQFRSYPPNTENVKYFPNLETMANGSLTYEVLPSVSRTMNFRGVVRDNFPGVGCITAQDVTVTTNADCTFNITSHNTTTSLVADGSNTTTLTWNTGACATCSYVRIKFSTDGGRTFPYVLNSLTTNDGSEVVTVPNLPTCKGRFMIECIDNIFFTVNNADIAITNPTCLANAATIAPTTTVVANVGSPSLNLSMAPQYGSLLTISGTINTTDFQGKLVLTSAATNNCVYYSNPTYNDTFSFYVTQSGSYTFTGAGDYFMMFNLYENAFIPNSPCSNQLAATGQLTGSSYNTVNKTFTVDLCVGMKYILVASSTNDNQNYTVAVSGPGTLNTGVAQPSGYAYRYVIVGSDNLIKAIKVTPDLSNASEFGADEYRVFGLSAPNYYASTDYNIWLGYPIANMQNASLVLFGGWCLNLTPNYRTVSIGNPLTLAGLNLSAYMVNKQLAQINWSVKEENEVNYYELERSYNGSDFEKIYTEHSLLGANATYQYQDAALRSNFSVIYYRLRSVMKDNSSSLSHVVKVAQTPSNIAQMSIIPNPIKNNQVVANVTALESGSYEMSVIDLTGRILKTQIVQIEEGNHNYSLSATDIPSGMYILRVINKGMSSQVKFVIE